MNRGPLITLAVLLALLALAAGVVLGLNWVAHLTALAD